jgi:ammonium transporter Rh
MSKPLDETSSLLPKTNRDLLHTSLTGESLVNSIFIATQVIIIVFFFVGTKYSHTDFDVREYIAYRDVMAMLLLGFGYLMTFLKTYGLGAVGFTLMLSVLSMELNILVELSMRYLNGDGSEATSWPMPISMATLVDSEFAAATLMITYGAVIGRASPLQLLIICVSQSFFYAFNKVILVLGIVGSEDVGGSMTIHMFGAYFGLAASYVLGGPKDLEAGEHFLPDRVSDVMALIGTTILWVFWPSFVGATEVGDLSNEGHCVVNTIIALLGSTTVTFFLSHKLNHGKFDPVHIANSTLAGGVAIGSAGRLNIGPGWAMMTGVIAGAVSVCGYKYSSPLLQSKFGIYDTCGVGNLHGYPSIVGALLSIGFVALDPKADFLEHSMASQMFRQLFSIIATLGVSIASGYGTGYVASKFQDNGVAFVDTVWWHLEYTE